MLYATATAQRHRIEGGESASTPFNGLSLNPAEYDDIPSRWAVEAETTPEVSGKHEKKANTSGKRPVKVVYMTTSDRPSMVDVARFVGKTHRLAHGDEHFAVDGIYRFIDDRLLSGRETALAECDEALKSVDPGKLTVAQIVSFLIVTRRARGKGKLLGRDRFYERAHTAITDTLGSEKATRILEKYR